MVGPKMPAALTNCTGVKSCPRNTSATWLARRVVEPGARFGVRGAAQVEAGHLRTYMFAERPDREHHLPASHYAASAFSIAVIISSVRCAL